MKQAVLEYRRYLSTSDLAPSTKKEYDGLCLYIMEAIKIIKTEAIVSNAFAPLISPYGSMDNIISYAIKNCSPSKARKICIVLKNSLQLTYGINREIIIPTIHNAKKRPILTWTMNEYNYFTTHATPTASRIAQFAYMTGQRVSDLVDFIVEGEISEGDIIEVVQHKTGTKCYVPVTNDLAEFMNSSKYEHIIYTIMGTKLTASSAAYQIKSDIKNLNMRGRLSIHGLRKLFAATMASHGCTVYEIAAVTGHLNVNNLSLYTYAYDRLIAAKNIFRRIAVDSTD